MTANSVIDLLAALPSPDWIIEGLAEQLLGIVSAQPYEEFVLDAAAATDRQSEQLVSRFSRIWQICRLPTV